MRLISLVLMFQLATLPAFSLPPDAFDFASSSIAKLLHKMDPLSLADDPAETNRANALIFQRHMILNLIYNSEQPITYGEVKAVAKRLHRDHDMGPSVLWAISPSTFEILRLHIEGEVLPGASVPAEKLQAFAELDREAGFDIALDPILPLHAKLLLRHFGTDPDQFEKEVAATCPNLAACGAPPITAGMQRSTFVLSMDDLLARNRRMETPARPHVRVRPRIEPPPSEGFVRTLRKYIRLPARTWAALVHGTVRPTCEDTLRQ